jgi:Xaa-Pro aminopeptidase
MPDYAARIERARAQMRQRDIALLFLPVSSTLEYLTGIPREEASPTEHNRPGDWVSGMYLGLERGPIIVEPRMGSDRMERHVAGKPWISDLRVLGEPEDYSGVLAGLVRDLRGGSGKIALGDRAWAKTAIDLQAAAPDAELVNAHEFLAPMRAIKDDEELAIMRRASRLTDDVYAAILPRLELGMSERDIAWVIEREILRHSDSGTSFNTGIRIGGNVARPGSIHDSLTATTLERGAVLAFDFGLLLDGYCSDFGRTVFIGEPGPERRAVHDLVMHAQTAAIAEMKDGQISAAQLDRVARSIIETAGRGPQFIHRLGHAIGKDVHEPPFLLEGDDTVLLNGMCFTIEPSVFMEDGGFVRVEDVVLVTPDGGESFNTTGHDLLVLAL